MANVLFMSFHRHSAARIKHRERDPWKPACRVSLDFDLRCPLNFNGSIAVSVKMLRRSERPCPVVTSLPNDETVRRSNTLLSRTSPSPWPSPTGRGKETGLSPWLEEGCPIHAPILDGLGEMRGLNRF